MKEMFQLGRHGSWDFIKPLYDKDFDISLGYVTNEVATTRKFHG
jgi:hypothetical protein